MPLLLMRKSETEARKYFDKNIRALPKNPDGSINVYAASLHNNDVDAFRHAYTSGRFTQEYGAWVAEMLGNLYENVRPNPPGERNMDLWNNAIGRTYGKKTRTKRTLLEALRKALKNGELIITPKDRRKYSVVNLPEIDPTKPVVVLKESETGRNQQFFDMSTQKKMTRSQFVAAIRRGEYPGYRVSNFFGVPTPVSKPDGSGTNNLG